MVDETQISTPPEPTRYHNLIKLWILLPFRADLFPTLQYEIPCSSRETCSGLAPFPSSIGFATGGKVDKTPVLCGGYITSEVDGVHVHSITPSSKCYYHDRNLDSWILIGNMNTARAAAGSIVIDSKLWVIGGSADGLTGLDTTEFIDMKNGGKITYGPPLPEGGAGHCVVALNKNEVMTIGGHKSPLLRKTKIYNNITGDWRDGPNLKSDRHDSACALFRSSLHENRMVVLVAGGDATVTAEILDYSLGDASWALSK